MTHLMLIVRAGVFFQVQILGGSARASCSDRRELCADAEETVSPPARSLPCRCHKGATALLFLICTSHFSSTNFLMVVLLKYPLPPHPSCHFPAQRTAVSQGGRLPAAGMQTGAHPPAGRAHPAALHAHVLHPETLLGLPQEDRGAAGTVPRLPHEVSQASFSSNGSQSNE